MTNQSLSLYDTLVFKYFKWVLVIFALLLVVLTKYTGNFRLDASSDSLVLENDQSLKYFRDVVAKYNTAELLIITYSPQEDLFDAAVLQDIKRLRESLLKLDQTESVISIVDAPLVQSPPASLAELAGSPRTLLDEGTDLTLAKKEFLTSDLYRDLLVSNDFSTTAIVVSLKGNDEVSGLMQRRNALRELRDTDQWSPQQAQELAKVTLDHQVKAQAFQQSQSAMIKEVRYR